MFRILSVSYDEVLLHTRRLILEAAGYSVVSAVGFKQSLDQCKHGGFDLFILGHSIPNSDKEALIKEFRASCPAPIVSLLLQTEIDVAGADYYIEPKPKAVLALVRKLGSKPKPAHSEISSIKTA